MKKLLMTAGAVMLAAVAQADLKDEITIRFSSDGDKLSEEYHIEDVEWEGYGTIQSQYSLSEFMDRLQERGGEMTIQVSPCQGYTFDGVSMPYGWSGDGRCRMEIDVNMLNDFLAKGEAEPIQGFLAEGMSMAFEIKGPWTFELNYSDMPVAKRSPVQVNWTVGNHVNASVTKGNVAISNGAQVSLPATIDVSAVADDGYIFKNPGAGWSLSADGKTITQSFLMEVSFGNSRLEFSIPSPVRPEVTIGNVASVKPWVSANGEVAVDYSVANINADGWYKVAFDITAGGKTAGVTNDAAQLVEGAQAQKVIATTALFGKETVSKDAKVKVTLIAVKPKLGGVQLWEGGPFFAECNVGANAPQEYGYYFWWGDTVGYTNNGATVSGDKKWLSVADGTTAIKFSNESPANTLCGKDATALADYVDANGNLKSDYDAATKHLGPPWRMMTKDELDKLVSTEYCQSKWVTEYKGVTVKGYVVKGKAGSAYENNEVFFPAAGYGNGSNLNVGGTVGHYWSSTPVSYNPNSAQYLDFNDDRFDGFSGTRYFGYVVRPVR